MSDNIPRDMPQVRARPDAADIMTEVAFTLVRCSPDRVNEIGRDAGLTVQPVAMTDPLGGKIYLSWPPREKGQPDYEYGLDERHLMFALGYEIFNLLRLSPDKLGR